MFWSMGSRAQVSVAAAHRLYGLWSAGSVLVVDQLSCFAAYGLFPDEGSNPRPMHWQANSQPMDQEDLNQWTRRKPQELLN